MANPIHMALIALPTIFVLLAPFGTADYVLYSGEVLLAGQNLTNGRFQLSMQPDCDLVLHEDGNPTWRASTSGEGGNCYLALKATGELVVRRNVHYTLWSSGSKSKKGKYALALDGKGKIAVYGLRRWTTNNAKERGRHSSSVISTGYVLYSGERLTGAKRLVYKDYELGLARCNLIIKDTRSDKVLWQTSTKANGCYLAMEADGELALKHGSQRLWSSDRKAENGMYIAVLRFDGRAAVYGPLLWSNDKINDDDSVASGDVGWNGGFETSSMLDRVESVVERAI